MNHQLKIKAKTHKFINMIETKQKKNMQIKDG